MMTLRLFPFITSLPLEAIQAQGEIKTIIKARKFPGNISLKNDKLTVHGQQLASKLVEHQNIKTSDGNDLLSILSNCRL